MYQFVEKLPTVNLTNDFLILKDIENSIKNDWFEFCNHFICQEIKKGDSSLSKNKEIQNYIPNSNGFISFSPMLRNLFGFDKQLQILEFEFNSGIYSIITKTSYKNLIDKYYNSKNIRIDNKTFTAKSILTRFFIFQKFKNRLIFPLTGSNLGKVKYDFSSIFGEYSIYNPFINYLQNHSTGEYIKYEIKAINMIMCCTKWENNNAITSENINQFQTFCVANKQNIPSANVKNSMLNKLRSFLIENGNMNIDTPTNFINSIRVNTQTNTYAIKNDPFEWLSIDEPHKLFDLKTDANLYLKRLHADGMKTATRKKYMVSINHLLRYIIKEQEALEKFNEDSVNKLFDTNNGKNFFLYLQIMQLTEGTIFETINIIKKFLEFCGLMTSFAKKHIPKRRMNRRTITPRNAMPQNMVNDLKEILTQRPPKPSTVWLPNKASLFWWEHKEIYPVQPLMLLMHLNIPIRGGQLRHLCRNKSLVLNDSGIDRFIINTDKNVNRKELQEIPNVWNELNILNDYLKWNKEYFPNLPKYKYNNEDNTPWEDIEPLFLIPNSLQPITAYQHRVYLTKLLCTYQIEMDKAYAENIIKHKVKIAWKKDESKFFETIDELNQANDTYLMNEIKVSYDIHSIRVTGITRYLQAGVNLNVLLMLTGHVDYNMIVNVYTKFTQEEKKEILQSAVEKLRFDQPESIVNNIENFIFNEIPSNYNTKDPKDIKRAFTENGLFSMKRKATTLNDIEIGLGTDLASLKHPSSWFPMISGICPGVQCPEGRERRCSLCSYFVTGKIFLNGIIHMANMTMASFVRLSKEHTKEKEVSNRYCDTKSTKLELLVEELIGWHQIIEKVENDIKNSKDNLPVQQNKKYIEYKDTPIELTYLENCYNAKLMGVEQDAYGLKLLTIKAIKFASSLKDNDKIEQIINNEIETVDYLMGYYLDYKSKNLLSTFIHQLESKI